MQKDKKTKFVNSLKAFKNIRVMCAAAFLCALAAVIAYLCKFLTFGDSIRITFENLPIILSGYLFGPVVGMATGIIADIANTSISYGLGNINPILTLGVGCVGFASGFISNFVIPKSSRACLPVSVFSAHIIGNMIVKSIGKFVYYHTPMPVLLLNVPIYAVTASIELILLILLLRSKGIRKAIGKFEI